MIEVTDKSNCSGCSACAQICPQQCISMLEDVEGFLYPSVNKEVCVNCHLCEKICPISNTKFRGKTGFPDGYLIYDTDKTMRTKSAAGGGFVALARYFIEQYQGVVFGAVYDKDYSVQHISVDSISELSHIQKSKYVQSRVDHQFIEAKKLLLNDRYVLFSGTPCQIYGLKSYLGKLSESPKLFCVDLSCHGVPSPKVFRNYLKALEEQEKSKITSYTMRDKKIKKHAYDQGFHICFENGADRFYTHTEDMFGRCFWGEIASRPSCYQCHFKTVWRTADITLGDCWFFNVFVPSEEDSLGVTMALVHSEKGKQLIHEANTIKRYSIDSEKLIKANGGMIYSSAKPHKDREAFFAELDMVSFPELTNRYVPKKPDGKKQKVLDVLEKQGIRLEFFRKINRKRRLNKRLSAVIPEAALGEKV